VSVPAVLEKGEVGSKTTALKQQTQNAPQVCTVNLVRLQFANQFLVNLNDRLLRLLVSFQHQSSGDRTLQRWTSVLDRHFVELTATITRSNKLSHSQSENFHCILHRKKTQHKFQQVKFSLQITWQWLCSRSMTQCCYDQKCPSHFPQTNVAPLLFKPAI